MLVAKIKRYSAGVYQILNLKNGNFYIGSSVNVYNRFHTHKTKLNQNIHINKYLQNAYNKYGKNEFLFRVLEYCNKDEVIKKEQHYLNLLRPKYNHRTIAQVNLGLSPSENTKSKISATLKQKYKQGLIAYKQDHAWRPIVAYDLEGILVNSYKCIMDACRDLNISKANLRRALNNKGRAGKYQFRDKDDSNPGKYLPNVNQYGKQKN